MSEPCGQSVGDNIRTTFIPSFHGNKISDDLDMIFNYFILQDFKFHSCDSISQGREVATGAVIYFTWSRQGW
jgi:hypothetical protein